MLSRFASVAGVPKNVLPAFAGLTVGTARSYSAVPQASLLGGQSEVAEDASIPSRPRFEKGNKGAPASRKQVADVDSWLARSSRRDARSAENEPQVYANDREKLADLVNKRKTLDAFTLYKSLCESDQRESLSFLDHARVMSAFRLSRLNDDFERLEYVFEQMDRAQSEGKFEIPAPVYETMLTRSWRRGVEKTQRYFEQFKRGCGEAALSVPAFAALMNAQRHAGNHQEVLRVFEQAEASGCDGHSLLPIVMEALMELDQEPQALEVFEQYAQAERGALNVAKIHTWLAAMYVRKDRLDEAVQCIERMADRNVSPSSGSYGILFQVALKRGKLDDAKAYLFQEMQTSATDSFGDHVAEMIQAVKQDIPLMMEILEMYSAQLARIPTLRYEPFLIAMKSLREAGEVEMVRSLFNNINRSSKWRNQPLLTELLEAYKSAGMMWEARQAYNMALRQGLDVKALKNPLPFSTEGKSVVPSAGGAKRFSWQLVSPSTKKSPAAETSADTPAAQSA